MEEIGLELEGCVRPVPADRHVEQALRAPGDPTRVQAVANAHSRDDRRFRRLERAHGEPESLGVLRLALDEAGRRQPLQRRRSPRQRVGDHEIVGWIGLERSREVPFRVTCFVHETGGGCAQQQVVCGGHDEAASSVGEHERGFGPSHPQGVGAKQHQGFIMPGGIEETGFRLIRQPAAARLLVSQDGASGRREPQGRGHAART